jgi:ABC-type Fe3+ transport system substrate-binding protein
MVTLVHRMAVTALLAALLVVGCGDSRQTPPGPRTDEADARVRSKWGKGLWDLPIVTLDLISPHNENIQNEFAWAFSLHHAIEHGQRVELVWWDVGGGGSSIEKYLLNVYERADSAKIDILWGGGEFTHMVLAGRGLLEPMKLADDVLANVDERFGGVPMYAEAPPGPDGGKRVSWIGSAVSGFGFLYNGGLLNKCKIAPPRRWEDLGDARFSDLLALADPGQSASAAAAYRMIVLSERTWPGGWGKLLGILSNAKRFTDSAGAAANSPVLGEAPVATCIDFYGVIRVAEAPDELAYVSPPGQTTFSPDPIAILKNPPHPELARRFVDFVMSRRGQALWALPVGQTDGPMRFVLGRQPIRRDVYQFYEGKLTESIVNPYRTGQAMEVPEDMEKVDFSVLRQLVLSAAVDNIDGLRAARGRLNKLQADPATREEYQRRLGEFNRLPQDIDSLGEMKTISARFGDPKLHHEITTGWREFFRRKYADVAR